jgi:hypothetical protein
VLGDFNLPNIDWSTGMAITGEAIGNAFAKTVKDNFLYQLVDFPTREDNI